MSKGPYYKTTADYNKYLPNSHLMNISVNTQNESKQLNIHLNTQQESKQINIHRESKPNDVELDMKWETLRYSKTVDPQVWGPAFWFILHNGSSRYPEKEASPVWKESMRGFILGIPVMIPCEICADHARAHIEANWNNLDEIVSNRKNLFNFFVDMHNMVNKRYGKPIMSHEDAFALYTTSNVNVTKLSYN